MKLFEINNIIVDFSVNTNHFNCIDNDISGSYYEIDHKYINYETLYTKLPLYTEDNIDELNDGIYIWMLLTCNNNEAKMYIIQCQNINELGTKHSNIIQRLFLFHNKQQIFMHYAGEMKKENDEIELNFISGSYMREIFEDNEITNLTKIFEEDYRSYYVKEIIEYLYSKTKNKIKFTNDDKNTFLTKENIPLKKEHLNLYKECNCEIRKFYNITECKQYLENRKSWQRYYNKIYLYEINKNKYEFLKPPEKPIFKFEGELY
jgi:hypothetical protein